MLHKLIHRTVSMLAGGAATAGCRIASKAELLAFLDEWIDRNDISDEAILAKWEERARREGTINTPTDFPFGHNATGEVA